MPKPNKIASLAVAWVLVGGLLLAGSATIGQGSGTILDGPGMVLTPDMTDKPSTDPTAPTKVRFGPFTRTYKHVDNFGMDWSSQSGLARILISGCYDKAQLVLNGKIIFDSFPGQGNRNDQVNVYIKDLNHMTLKLQGGCLAANVYVTVMPVIQLCPDCGDMASRDITVVGGFLTGYYYYMPTDHPDVGTGPISGDVPGDHDWWDDKYFSSKGLWDVPKWSTLPPPLPPVTPPTPLGGRRPRPRLRQGLALQTDHLCASKRYLYHRGGPLRRHLGPNRRPVGL